MAFEPSMSVFVALFLWMLLTAPLPPLPAAILSFFSTDKKHGWPSKNADASLFADAIIKNWENWTCHSTTVDAWQLKHWSSVRVINSWQLGCQIRVFQRGEKFRKIFGRSTGEIRGVGTGGSEGKWVFFNNTTDLLLATYLLSFIAT